MRKTFIKLKTVNNLKSFINELTSKNRKQGFNRIKITPLINGIINRFMKFSKNNNIKNTFNNNYRNGYIEGNRNFIKIIKRIALGLDLSHISRPEYL